MEPRYEKITYIIKSGDSFEGILNDIELDKKEISRILDFILKNKVKNIMLADDQLFKDSLNYFESFDNSDSPFGLDAKLRLSQSSYLDLTINPDFGQIEMDPEYINLSYYETYLPEKRTFFNESISIFELPIEVFYSRRIGSANDSLDSRINYALKYIGSSESGWNLGTIAAETSEQNGTKKYFINRISKDIFNGNSIVGFLSTNLLIKIE